MADKVPDRILIVESDPIISDLISRQALKAAGYQTYVVSDAGTAIGKAVQLAPDMIIANLILPDLSGKDLMVALNSQNIDIPIVILVQKGSEEDIIQAFRLGAADYLLWPVRETEVITVVERVLKQVRERRERERLSRQLQQTNQELQLRVRELTTIFSIGKAVVSMNDQTLLFEKILDGAARVTQADLGWFLLKDESSKAFLLTAQKNLPQTLPVRINAPWDDSISSLVAMSGEPLSIHGDPLKRFKIAVLGQSALIVPVRAQKLVIGLLVVMRKQAVPFSDSDKNLLEAVADYASISLVNVRLFKEVEDRAQVLQRLVDNARNGQKISNELLQTTQKELRTPMDVVYIALERLLKDPTAKWTADQRQVMTVFQNQLQNLRRIVEAIPSLEIPDTGPEIPIIRLNDAVRRSANNFQHFAQANNLTLVTDIPAEPVAVRASSEQVGQILDGLLSNAVKFCNPGGRVTVKLERTSDGLAHIEVRDTGIGLDQAHAMRVFDGQYRSEQSRPRRFGGLGIGLVLTKEIVTYLNGKIWVDSQPGKGTTFHVTFPLYRQP
jgi:signal transduction histidine kinase/DNA-binding response OmpR family regulator